MLLLKYTDCITVIYLSIYLFIHSCIYLPQTTRVYSKDIDGQTHAHAHTHTHTHKLITNY